jgi:putative heme-binding domain-containing protein
MPAWKARGARRRIVAAIVAAIVATGVVMPPVVSAQSTTGPLARGRSIFDSQCSRCHGIGGSGGTGPDLRRPTLRWAATDADLFDLIAGGIPKRGMPQAWQLSDAELRAVVAYVRSLGRVAREKLPGDSAAGHALFAGKAACLGCHIVAGGGGSFGPDLSDVGVRRGAAYLRQALLDPGAAVPVGMATGYASGEYARYLPVRVVTARGEEVTGYRINEDDFTIQVRATGGRVRSFQKSQVRTLEKQFGRSLMPSVRGVMSDRELDNIIAYLASLRGGQ